MTGAGNPSQPPDIDARYVAARRVLLDALTVLAPHGDAFILAAAQAVYLYTAPPILPSPHIPPTEISY
jgi:hypothetical protein